MSPIKVSSASVPFTIYVPIERPPLFARIWKPYVMSTPSGDIERWQIQINAALIPDWRERNLQPRMLGVFEETSIGITATSKRAPLIYPCNYAGKCEAAEIDWLVRELQRKDAMQMRRETIFDDRPLRLELNTYEWCAGNSEGARHGTSLGLLSVSFPVSDYGWRLPETQEHTF